MTKHVEGLLQQVALRGERFETRFYRIAERLVTRAHDMGNQYGLGIRLSPGVLADFKQQGFLLDCSLLQFLSELEKVLA